MVAGSQMRRIAAISASALILAAVSFTATPTQAVDDSVSCDEACLKGFMDLYVKALAAHNPGLLPVASNYRYTENGAQIPLGQALWVTFNHLGPYRHEIYDPQTGGIAAYFTIMENQQYPFPDLLAVRLKIADHKITEIETVVNRDIGTEHAYKVLPPQDPTWLGIMDRVEPENSRVSRAALIKGALGYMRSVTFHDPKLAPYAESCIRMENSGISALGPHDTAPVPPAPPPPAVPGQPPAGPRPNLLGLGCGEQLKYMSYSFITGYEDARFPVVDEKRQVVYAMFDFVRRGNVESWQYKGQTVPMGRGMRYPNEILNTEMFKFVNGKITRVEAVFEGPQAYLRGTGWPGGSKVEQRPIGQ